MFKILSAEFLKLKGTFTYILPLIVVGASCAVAGLALVLDAHFSLKIGVNPWNRLQHGGLVVYTHMLYAPFLILLVSAVYYIEQRANAWKLLFVQPVNRSLQYFCKILLLILLSVGTSLLMFGCLTLTGYLVNLLMPEFGFTYFSPDLSKLGRILLYTSISGLGILGVQSLLSYRFSNILVPTGLGVMGFVVSFLLAATGSRFTLYLPYAYSMINPELETFPFEYQTYPIPGVSNTELLSISWFVLSVGVGYFYNRQREVHS